MATGGSVSLGSKPNITFTVYYSVSRNLSNVTILLSTDVSGVSGASYYGYPLYATPTVNGAGRGQYTLKNASPSQWSAFNVGLGTHSTTVSDLSQTWMPVSVYFTGNGKSCTLYFNATLPNVAPDEITSSVDFVVGSDLDVTMERPSASFTHSLKITVDGTDIHTWTGLGASATLDLSNYADTIYALVTDANSAPVVATLTTYNGSTLVGSTTKNGTASFSAPACLPTFNGYTVANSDTSLTGDNMVIIPTRSTLTLTMSSAAGNKGASMVSFFATCGDKSASCPYSAGATLTLSNVNSNQVSVQAIDSRGNYTTIVKDFTVLDYVIPQIGSISLPRDNAVDETVKLIYSGKFWNDDFGAVTNAIQTATWRYRLNGAETWTNGTSVIMPTASGGTFSFEGYITPVSGGWNSDNSYEIEITVSDRIGSATLIGTINVGVTAIDVRRVGAKYWAGFGKVPDVANMPNGGIDVEGDIFNYGINASDIVLECKNYAYIFPTIKSGSGNGLTWTIDHSDNTITINGTASADTWLAYTGSLGSDGAGADVTNLQGKEVTLSIIPANCGVEAFAAFYTGSGNAYIDVQLGIVDSYTFTVPNNALRNRSGVCVPNGTTVSNVKIKLLFQETSVIDTNYVPHAMSNLELTNSLLVKRFTKAYSVTGNNSLYFDASFITIPSGYVILGFMGVSTNNDRVVPRSWRYNGDLSYQYSFEIQNFNSSTISKDFVVYVLFARADLVTFDIS